MAQTTMTHASGQAKPPRSAALDGMKGLMMITIIIYYYFQNYLPGGFLAVNAFFVIGGYLAFRNNQKTLQQRNVHGRLREKASRLWIPMLWMIIGTIAFIYLVMPEHLRNLRYMALSSLFFVNNDYQIFNQQSYFVQSLNPSPFIHLWYVSLYLQFMIVAVVIRKLFARGNLLRMQESLILLLLAVLSAVGMGVLYWWEQDPSHAYYLLSTRIFSFFLGGMLSYFTEGLLSLPADESASQRMMTHLLGVASVGTLGAMMVYFNGTQASTYYWGMQLFSFIFLIFMVTGLYEKSVLNYILRFRGFTVVGRRSYSYYLWFYPVHLLAPNMLTRVEQSWQVFAIQMGLIIVLAEISYRFFEKKQWRLPIGQSLQFSQIGAYFNSSLAWWKKILGTLLSLGYLAVLGFAVLGTVQSVEGKSQTAQELEAVIKRNQETIEQTTQEASTTIDPARQLETKDQVAQTPTTFVGDSILLAAADKIQTAFPNAVIDGKIGRQLYNSVSELTELGTQNKLMNTVVTILGTNGPFSSAQLDNYIQTLGNGRDIYFVTTIAPVNWIADVNRQLQDATTRFTNVHVLDWGSYAANHPEWFYEDQIHPNEEGSGQLASFILDEMTRIHLGQ